MTLGNQFISRIVRISCPGRSRRRPMRTLLSNSFRNAMTVGVTQDRSYVHLRNGELLCNLGDTESILGIVHHGAHRHPQCWPNWPASPGGGVTVR